MTMTLGCSAITTIMSHIYMPPIVTSQSGSFGDAEEGTADGMAVVGVVGRRLMSNFKN